ncbi:hypothetical protein Tco_1526776 [Tanacetum coccineum]
MAGIRALKSLTEETQERRAEDLALIPLKIPQPVTLDDKPELDRLMDNTSLFLYKRVPAGRFVPAGSIVPAASSSIRVPAGSIVPAASSSIVPPFLI